MFFGGEGPRASGPTRGAAARRLCFLWGRDPFLRREKEVPSPQAPIFLQTGFGTHKKRRHAASFFVRGVPGDPACRGRHDGHGSRQAGLQSNRAAGGTAMDQVRRPISPAMIRRRGPPMPIRKKFWKGGAGRTFSRLTTGESKGGGSHDPPPKKGVRSSFASRAIAGKGHPACVAVHSTICPENVPLPASSLYSTTVACLMMTGCTGTSSK